MTDLQRQLQQRLDAGETVAEIRATSSNGKASKIVVNFKPDPDLTYADERGHYYSGAGSEVVTFADGLVQRRNDGNVSLKLEQVTSWA